MNGFWKWLTSAPDPNTERAVTLWVDVGRGAAQVAKVRIKRSDLIEALEKFDTLSHLTFPIEEVEE